LNRPLEADSTLQILTPKSPEALEVYRHSTAHLLAAAVLELYPKPNSAWGRLSTTVFITTSSGRRLLPPRISKKIEKKMWELQAQDLPTSANTAEG